MTSHLRAFAQFLAAAAAMLLAPLAAGQEFAAVVSPPRFEITAKPGERVRQVVEITNASSQRATYYLRTADWKLSPDAGVSFSDELADGSCRPWVAIERREVVIPGGGQVRYRFEVQPPASTPDGECRFALLIEGDEQTVRTSSGLNVPVSGRIAVIVYLTVGAAAADLKIVGTALSSANGPIQPVLQVQNSGNAHGRLAGFLSGTDATGRKLDFEPASLPILPGEVREIALSASDGSAGVTDIAYPVRIKGMIELGENQRVEFEHQFAR